MFFGCLRADEVDGYWPVCSEMLRASFRDKVNCYTVDDYYKPLKDGALQLWAAIEDSKVFGAVVTSIDEGSAMKICVIHSMAGENLSAWVSLFDTAVTRFARDNGCYAIEAITRKGFTKIFPDLIEDGTIYVRILK